jgi:putative transposase
MRPRNFLDRIPQSQRLAPIQGQHTPCCGIWQMPRSPRVFQLGLSHHVYQRGHNCAAIFHEPADYQYFLELVRWAVIENEIDVHAFTLMSTHYHLVTTPRSASALPRAMKEIDGGYVRYFNRKHSRLGTLWCGRYKAKPLLDERYFWTCFTYVERNPVEAGIVAAAADYEWSSHRVHACGAPSDWLVTHPLYEGLGSTAAERQAAYRAIFARS